MTKSLLLISGWLFLSFGTCNNNQSEKTQTSSDTTQSSAQQTTIKDSISPTTVGIGNSDVKDTSKKTTKKFYPVPGGPDERKLDSLKNANDKNKK